MDTITIEIHNPRVRDLIDNLVSLDLITVLPTRPDWRSRWKALSARLPDITDISEQDISDEIQAVRQANADK